MYLWVAVVSALLIAGATSASPAHADEVVLIGDPIRVSVARALSGASTTPYFVTAAVGGTRIAAPAARLAITDIADRLHASGRAVLVLDATFGPTPQIREHVVLARQASATIDGAYFARAERLGVRDRDELIALEREEIRALLEAYTLPVHDLSVGVSPEPIEAVRPEHAHAPDPASGASLDVPVRNLALGLDWLSEAERLGIRPVRANDALTLWVAGQRRGATALSAIQPGEMRETTVEVSEPLRAPVASRCFLSRGGQLRGVCTVVGSHP